MIQTNCALSDKHTFQLKANARFYAAIDTAHKLKEALEFAHQKEAALLPMGGGSNLVFMNDYPGLILHALTRGIKRLDENKTHATLAIEAGEPWHQVVCYALNHQLYGLENLAYIPGSAGGAPVQNIGAFGVELAHWFVAADVTCLKTGRQKTLNKKACCFGYRDSVFKDKKNAYYIERIYLKLSKKPIFFTQYHRLKQALNAQNNHTLTQASMMATIQQLRSHLPNPNMLPNAGSFFKNPMISKKQFNTLQQHYPNMPAFPVDDHRVKCAAGWLIEQIKPQINGWCRIYTHPRHALILTHDGKATADELRALIQRIQTMIQQQFNITLIPEVRLI
jgi:UDP-N-acetylmuramate dehydrogenase